MGRREQIAPGEFYHIYNRGTEKRTIFMSTKDYERFLALLYACNGSKPVDLKLQGSTLYQFLALNKEKKAVEKKVDVCAYALMPNHFHLIVRSSEEGDVAKFMQKISTGYTMYFNTRYERSGALFQGKYKAIHADSDTYLAYLIAYVHLNPVQLIRPTWKTEGIGDLRAAKEFLQSFRWSSYPDYLGIDRPEKAIVSMDALPGYWSSHTSFESFVTDWLKNEQETPMRSQSLIFAKEDAPALI
ncbi:MAG: transposase [Candidatus Kaiserbacteria bacterium]|nr:MAG: transposase [Candidatus Kaiserbacteria bacterium]